VSTNIDTTTVLNALTRHIGIGNGVNAHELVCEITGHSPAMPSAENERRQLRHAIAALRQDGQHICGHPSTGYYIAANEAELNRACDFLYARAMTSLQQVAQMKRVSVPDLRGQLRLPN